MTHIDKILTAGLEAYGLLDRVPPGAVPALDRYSQLLLEKNQTMNLTAIREPEQVAQLPEQPPVFRCRSRCTTASAMSAASTRQTRIVARFIAAGPFLRILLPV